MFNFSNSYILQWLTNTGNFLDIQAAEEIIRNKNIAFDPLIVEAFVLEKDNFKEIKNKFRDRSNLEKFKS